MIGLQSQEDRCDLLKTLAFEKLAQFTQFDLEHRVRVEPAEKMAACLVWAPSIPTDWGGLEALLRS
jgi:hypothetical protein